MLANRVHAGIGTFRIGMLVVVGMTVGRVVRCSERGFAGEAVRCKGRSGGNAKRQSGEKAEKQSSHIT